MRKLSLQITWLAFVFAAPVLAQKIEAIDKTETINVGGIKQVISIKGSDLTKPVLLYLHGAGSTTSSVIASGDKLTSKLREKFIVVLWDQRDYGQTLALNKSVEQSTIALMVNDTREVIRYLLQKFERKTLYLVGHSMGSVIGIRIAEKSPHLLSALVAISPPVNGKESQKLAVANLLRYFKKIGNERAVRELATIKAPTQDFNSLFIQYKWQTEFDGEKVTDKQWEETIPVLKKALSNSGKIYNEIYETNFFKEFPSLQCPVYFFAGRNDFVTNSTLTENFYKKVRAPKKGLFWFEKSAHGIPDTEPDKMQQTIIDKVLQ